MSSLTASTSVSAQPPGFVPQVGTWVNLRDLVSPLSHDQALLLCEASVEHWVAWVPDHGEALLTRAQFFGVGVSA